MASKKPYSDEGRWIGSKWFFIATSIGFMLIGFYWMWKAHQWHELFNQSYNALNSCIDTATRCVELLQTKGVCSP